MRCGMLSSYDQNAMFLGLGKEYVNFDVNEEMVCRTVRALEGFNLVRSSDEMGGASYSLTGEGREVAETLLRDTTELEDEVALAA